jgi:hypothetical protein
MKEIKSLFGGRDLIEDLRELCISELRATLSASVSLKVASDRINWIERVFSNVIRAVIVVASGLTHQKEVRDIFVDVVERVVEPLQKIDCSVDEVSLIFKMTASLFNSLQNIENARRERLARSFHRCMECVRQAVCYMWTRIPRSQRRE